MFRKAFQKGFLTVFFAGGSSPLRIWDRMIVNGHIKRITDEDVRTLALEMRGSNVATCYIFTPIHPKEVLGISLPFLVMIVKNLKKYFSFEIQVLDDRNLRRRFRVSNYQTTTKVRPFGTTMPIGLNPGWNQIQFNLADFTKRAYGSNYIETLRMQVHANCRIRRIYFCDKLYSEEELPNEYKLFYPCVEEKKKKPVEVKDVRTEVPPPSEAEEEMEEELIQDQDEHLEAKAHRELEEPEIQIEGEELSQDQDEHLGAKAHRELEEPEIQIEGQGGDEAEVEPSAPMAEDVLEETLEDAEVQDDDTDREEETPGRDERAAGVEEEAEVEAD